MRLLFKFRDVIWLTLAVVMFLALISSRPTPTPTPTETTAQHPMVIRGGGTLGPPIIIDTVTGNMLVQAGGGWIPYAPLPRHN